MAYLAQTLLKIFCTCDELKEKKQINREWKLFREESFHRHRYSSYELGLTLRTDIFLSLRGIDGRSHCRAMLGEDVDHPEDSTQQQDVKGGSASPVADAAKELQAAAAAAAAAEADDDFEKAKQEVRQERRGFPAIFHHHFFVLLCVNERVRQTSSIISKFVTCFRQESSESSIYMFSNLIS